MCCLCSVIFFVRYLFGSIAVGVSMTSKRRRSNFLIVVRMVECTLALSFKPTASSKFARNSREFLVVEIMLFLIDFRFVLVCRSYVSIFISVLFTVLGRVGIFLLYLSSCRLDLIKNRCKALFSVSHFLRSTY